MIPVYSIEANSPQADHCEDEQANIGGLAINPPYFVVL
jgi:hypothetical protein